MSQSLAVVAHKIRGQVKGWLWAKQYRYWCPVCDISGAWGTKDAAVESGTLHMKQTVRIITLDEVNGS